MTRPEGKDPSSWPKCSFFAIYDGHGGSMCADFLKDNLHQIIIQQDCFPSDPKKAL
jgi:protein phosphatase 2C family protein 2/3